MKLYDGVDVRVMSDQQLESEYRAINNHDYHSFYDEKLGYLWFRVREIYYELERRGRDVNPPTSFVGKKKAHFNHWCPPFGARQRNQERAKAEMTDDHTRYGKPISEEHKRSIVPIF